MRSKRIMVKLSLPMEVALDVLAQRQGLSPSTMAFMRLREALARTMETADVQRIVAERRAESTVEDWKHDQAMTAEQLKLMEVEDGDTQPLSQG